MSNQAQAAKACAGEMEVNTGTGLTGGVIANATGSEVPVSGSYRVICAVPSLAMSVAGTTNRSRLEDRYSVDRSLPFHRATVFGVKCRPLTSTDIPVLPARTCGGTSAVIDGKIHSGRIEKATGDEAPLPGLFTITSTGFCEATSALRIAADNWLLLTNVVVRGDPFHLTVAPETNPLPFTVIEKALAPAWIDAG